AIEELVKPIEGLVGALPGIHNDESLADVGIKDRRVFNGMVETPAVPPGFERQIFRQLIVGSNRGFMLAIRVQPGGNPFFRRGASGTSGREGAEVLVLQERQSSWCCATRPIGLTRSVRADAVAARAVECGNKRAEVCCTESVIAVLP